MSKTWNRFTNKSKDESSTESLSEATMKEEQKSYTEKQFPGEMNISIV